MEDVARSTLGDILQHLAQRHGWQRAQWLSSIQVIWSEIVGDTISRHTRILSLTEDGHLWVAVPSSVWSQELLYYKPRILAAISDALPVVRIADIRTRVQAPVNRHSAPVATPSYFPYFFTGRPRHSANQDLHELLQHVQEKYQIAAVEWLQNGFSPCTSCHAPTPKNYSLCVVCELQRRR